MSESEFEAVPETKTEAPKGKKMNAPVKSPMMELRAQLVKMESQWTAALPKHISVEKFMRVVQTALQGNPSLMTVDRRSLFQACTQAAQDGLLPNGREGAIVPFKGKARWMPMVQGLIKRARNSGEIVHLVARVVYAADHYRYWIDEDGEHLIYEPSDNPDLTKIVRVFAMAKTRDGALYVEPMSVKEIEKIRQVSQTGYDEGGIWSKWWEEMAKKTAIRRLSKRLPMSEDLEVAISRDDELYGQQLRQLKAVEVTEPKKPTPIKSLEDFGNGHGEEKPSPQPAKRGRKGKAVVESVVESSWWEKFKERLEAAQTADQAQAAWEEFAGDYETADEQRQVEASDLYNEVMDCLETEELMGEVGDLTSNQ